MNRQLVRVLLVEDNPGDARLVREMLSECPRPRFQVTHLDALDDALRCLQTRKFDAVVLDLMLDDSPRLGTLLEIYDLAWKVPIVVLSGLDDKTVGVWVLKEGAQDYLVKGQVDSATLVHSILTAMERHDRGANVSPEGGRCRAVSVGTARSS